MFLKRKKGEEKTEKEIKMRLKETNNQRIWMSPIMALKVYSINFKKIKKME